MMKISFTGSDILEKMFCILKDWWKSNISLVLPVGHDKILSLSNKKIIMALNSDKKVEIIKKFKKSDKDCGSSSVQIALLTENINKLSDHFNKNKKDNHSRQGLLKMIMKRRSLMKYLKKTDMSTYENLIKELGLRK